MMRPMSNIRGGYREGSGRKQGFSAKKAEETREVLAQMVMKEIVPIGEALITKAKGGDVQAIRELFDRAFGKPLQTNLTTLAGRTESITGMRIMFDPAFKKD